MLPDGLQNLTFGSNFNQTLANVKWPSNLQSLVVHEVFCQQLDVSLPSSLQSLDCMGLKASFTWNRWHLLAADPSCVTGWIFKTSKMAIWFHFETDDKSLHLDDHNTVITPGALEVKKKWHTWPVWNWRKGPCYTSSLEPRTMGKDEAPLAQFYDAWSRYGTHQARAFWQLL